MSSIGIIILNYQTHEDTEQLVASLQKQTLAKELFIVVVDNASPNNSYSYLKLLETQYSNIVVLQTGANLGYAKGNNYGLQYIDEHIHPEYVAILNNDVNLPKDCFEKLGIRYSELDNPAVIAPIMTTPNGERMSPHRINTYFDDVIDQFYFFKLFPKRNKLKLRDNTGKKAMKVDLIPGSFMFVKFETFKKMGCFYPNTFLYVEERFVAVAAKKQGLKNYIVLDQEYIHAHNSPTISSVYNVVARYRLLYVGWLEFTRVCRKNGYFKASILSVLMKYSLWEMKVVELVKNILINGPKKN
jgi:GT2 family glycosyltransferase